MTASSRGDRSTRTPAASTAGDGGLKPVPRSLSPVLQAFTSGLHRESESAAAGRKDAEQGSSFQPLPDWSGERLALALRAGDQAAIDAVFSYACGFVRASLTRRGGRHAAL